MQIIYEPKSDTLDVDFRRKVSPVYRTVDGPDEDILLDLDEQDRLVGLTIHHASRRTALESLRRQPQFEEVGSRVQA